MTRALPEAQRGKLLERIPLGRLGTPDDIAHAVAFLASPQAGYVPPEATLHVNGGMLDGVKRDAGARKRAWLQRPAIW